MIASHTSRRFLTVAPHPRRVRPGDSRRRPAPRPLSTRTTSTVPPASNSVDKRPTHDPGSEVWQPLTASTDTNTHRRHRAVLRQWCPHRHHRDRRRLPAVYPPRSAASTRPARRSIAPLREKTGSVSVSQNSLVGSSFTENENGSLLIRGDAYAEDGFTFMGHGLSGGAAWNLNNDGVNNVEIILNATDADSTNWTIEFIVGGTTVRGPFTKAGGGGRWRLRRHRLRRFLEQQRQGHDRQFLTRQSRTNSRRVARWTRDARADRNAPSARLTINAFPRSPAESRAAAL